MLKNKALHFMEEQTIIRWGFIFLFGMMALSGFGQMPIFKRYYIADIPGLGWLADFYFTHTLHYIGASLLIFLFLYVTAAYFLLGKKTVKFTTAGYVRAILLVSILITGVFRVLKNLPGITFSPGFTMFIDISHLTFMMMYVAAAIGFFFTKQGWLKKIED